MGSLKAFRGPTPPASEACADEGEFQLTEELYDTVNDTLELKNLAADASQVEALKTMRGLYDQRVAAWKVLAVPYHRYKPFGTIFDRNIPWAEKRHLVSGK